MYYSNLGVLFICMVLLAFEGCHSNKDQRSQTVENLKIAYRNEINASAQYSAFAKKAESENYLRISNLYNAISRSESIHAINHKIALIKIGLSPEDFTPDFELRNTSENLQISIEGEKREATILYIDYIAIAEKEGFTDAKKSFEWAKDAEMKHCGYFTASLVAISNNRINSLPDSFLVCPECGQTFEVRQVEEKCSSCRNPRANFISFP